MRRKHRTDCVKRLVPVESLLREARERRRHGYFGAERNLVLHDYVDDCMRACIWQANARLTMELFDHAYALAFIECVPPLRVWWPIGIVSWHEDELVD